MMVNAELYVKDLPGQLVGSLTPISLVNGNIVGVVHDREQIVNNRICVNVTFEIGSNSELDQLKSIWKSKDILIARMGSIYETFSVEYMLIGKFSAAYVEELIDQASGIVSFESVDVNYSSKNATSTRTAMISAEVRSLEDLEKLDKFLREASKKAGIVYIRGL
ncbi:MAG: homoserine dehydrogenase [Candidatus Methanoplasma sp.]|jgi:ACT domain-containing protein|nr:homoserine dehydrogenase [Candidatus Methanoplasma sp.]